MSSPIAFSRPRVLLALGVVLFAMLGTAATASAQLKATLFASGFNAPLGFVQDPSDPTVQVVLEQGGHVRLVKDGVTQSADFLDISTLLPTGALGERGLLGLAFSPDYQSSRRLFVSYTNTNGDSVISRYLRSAGNPLQADASTRFDLVWAPGQGYIAQPFANHNGGNIAFGPDGYLYIGFGDGGDGNDPGNRAQSPSTLLGKMLRINVSVADSDPEGYDVPANPFVGVSGVRPEIWSFGLRNPWRWSFDTTGAGGTGALVIGDVGQGAWEEVDYEPMGAGGRNYGWRYREGAHDNITSIAPFSTPLREPIWEFSHAVGNSITGGFVYRGSALGNAYRGRYFFADFARSRIWSIGLTIDPGTGDASAGLPMEHSSSLNISSPSSFGVDAAGELYVVSYGGSIYRIDREAGPTPGGCATGDPFGGIGGGSCLGGAWHSPRPPADFNIDASTDLLFQNTNGQLYLWYMTGVTMTGGSFLTPSQVAATLRVVGVADFTGDGKPDVLLQDPATGTVKLQIMNGLIKVAEQTMAVAPPWQIAATGDLNGDGYPDIIWQRLDTGLIYIWYMQGAGGITQYLGGEYLKNSAGTVIALGQTTWHIVGAADVSNDGKTDLVWQNDSTGDLKVSNLNGVQNNLRVLSETALVPGSANPAWKIRAVADFNADGRPDLIWQHASTGDMYAWFMAGPYMANGGYVSPARVVPAWQVAGPR